MITKNKKDIDLSRRGFLRLLGLVGAALGFAGCGRGTGGADTSGSTDSAGGPEVPDGGVPQGTASLLSALRDFGPDWQTFWGCNLDNSGGTLGVRIDGSKDFTGDSLIADNDYCGVVTATSLVPGVHTWQLLLNGMPVGSVHDFSTAPMPGGSFSLLFLGDTNTDVEAAMRNIAGRENAAAVFGTELYYLDASNLYGGPLYSDANNLGPTASNQVSYNNLLNGAGGLMGFRKKYRTVYSSEPSRLTLMRKWPLYNLPSNHDFGQFYSAPYISRPGVVRYDAAHKAAFEYPCAGHPLPTGDVDSEPAPVLYWNKVIGDIEIIAVDMMTYEQPLSHGNLNQANSEIPTGVGEDKQLDWVKSRIAASTAEVIILFTTSKSNALDEWKNINTGLFAYLAAFPSKTFIQIAGDIHQHYAILRGTNKGSTAGLLEIGCSPSAGVTSAGPSIGGPLDTVYMTDEPQVMLTQAYDGKGLTLHVANAGVFRARRKVGNLYGANPTLINAVDIATNTITLNSIMPAMPNGELVTPIDWPDSADIANDPDGCLAGYVKVLRYPAGSVAHPTPHIEIQQINTYTGRIRWRCLINDGQRAPTVV